MPPWLRYPRSIDRSLALPRAVAIPAPLDLLYPAALVLAVLLPFDVIRPVVVTPWLQLSFEKLLLLALGAAWLAQGARALPTPYESRTIAPTLLLTATAVVSALLAPDYVDDALKFVWRFAAAAFVGLVAIRIAQTGRTQQLLWALVLGAGASALLGLAEALGSHAFDPFFSLFKVAPTRVGGELRVSGSFQYATIASMYFEMLVPLALVLAVTAQRRPAQLLAAAIAAICTANVALSLTRAGILTLALVLVAVLLLSLRSSMPRLPALTAAAVLVTIVAVLARTNAVFDMRLSTESDADWYGAVYSAPEAMTAQPGQLIAIDLDVKNEGRITWSASDERHPYALGYRWLTADGTAVLDIVPGEVPLPRDVAPGDTIHLAANVEVPRLPAGDYRLDWGMLQRDVVQFYERGWANAETTVRIASSATPTQLLAARPRDDDEAPWVVGRLDLWGAGVRLAAQRPLFGFGPDNFRHFYGTQLGLERWDERVQANNLYLELLVDLGIAGLAAFLWQVLPITLRAVRHSDVVSLGLGLSLLAFLVHGLLDSFLAFTPTALLFWIVLGLAAITHVQKPQVSGR